MRNFFYLFFLLLPITGHAATLGSITVDDSALADGVSPVLGALQTYDAAAADAGINSVSPSDAVSDTNINTGIFCAEACQFDLLFTNNYLMNGIGNDLALFEGGGNEDMAVTINGVTVNLLRGADIEEPGFVDAASSQISYWLLDLDDFGLGAGVQVSSVRIDLLFNQPGGGGGVIEFSSADLVAAAALNSTVIPLPGAFPLLVAGIAGLALIRRRERRKIA